MTSLDDLKKTGDSSPQAPRRTRRWLLPLLGGGLVLAVLWMFFGDALTPAIPVDSTSVLLLESEHASVTVRPTSGKTVAQASGWIEPDPFEVLVSAQTAGTVQDVLCPIRADGEEGAASGCP